MDKPISAGDLAIIIKTTKNHDCNRLGLIVRVDSVRLNNRTVPVGKRFHGHCKWCGWSGSMVAEGRERFNVAVVGSKIIAVSSLKRIPPLEELDVVKRDESIVA